MDLFLLLAKLCGHHYGLQVRFVGCWLLGVAKTLLDEGLGTGCYRSHLARLTPSPPFLPRTRSPSTRSSSFCAGSRG